MTKNNETISNQTNEAYAEKEVSKSQTTFYFKKKVDAVGRYAKPVATKMGQGLYTDKGLKVYRRYGKFFLAAIVTTLLMMVAFSPVSGTRENNPTLNEVSERYVDKGLEEAGATNLVAGMILDYRAFDTFGEAIMIMTSAVGVILILRNPEENKAGEK